MSERFYRPSGALGPPGRHSLPTFTSVGDATDNASCLLYWISINKLEMKVVVRNCQMVGHVWKLVPVAPLQPNTPTPKGFNVHSSLCDTGKTENGKLKTNATHLPSHTLKSVIRSPLTNTSALGSGSRSTFSFPAEYV